MDLLVSFGDAQPAFAIISGGRLSHREHQYAVPLNDLSSPGKDSKLTLNANAATLQQAPSFDQQVWETVGANGSNQIYRYSTPED